MKTVRTLAILLAITIITLMIPGTALAQENEERTVPGPPLKMDLETTAPPGMLQITFTPGNSGKVQAARRQGSIPNLRLSSASPGELTISWDAPDPAPSDYRIVWAKQDLGFPSYKAANEANRGNEYPSGTETSITLTGLAKGETFRAMARSRYTSGGRNDGPWSGPWTGAATARVKDNPPAAPSSITAGQVAHDSVTLTWTAPGSGSTISGYRVVRGTDANNLSAIVGDTGNPGTEYTDSTVTAKTTYHYAVLALSQDGDGAQSNTLSLTTPSEPADQRKKSQPPGRRLVRTAPSEPTNLAVTLGDTQLTFAWDAPLSGDPALRYNYEFGPTGGTLVDGNHGTNPAGAQTLTKTGLTNGTEYHFRVRGVNGTTNTPETAPYAEIRAIPAGTTAAGVPVIRPANAFRVPGLLIANRGAISDSDGVPASSEFTWQWVRVDGTTETDIAGATAQTYTLTTVDAGKKIRVKANFTDKRQQRRGPIDQRCHQHHPRGGHLCCPHLLPWRSNPNLEQQTRHRQHSLHRSGLRIPGLRRGRPDSARPRSTRSIRRTRGNQIQCQQHRIRGWFPGPGRRSKLSKKLYIHNNPAIPAARHEAARHEAARHEAARHEAARHEAAAMKQPAMKQPATIVEC